MSWSLRLRTDDILPIIKKCCQSGIIVTAGKPPIIITKFNAATAIGKPALRPERCAANGKWPGEDDRERLDFFVNGDPDFPDLNRLFSDCVWDADTGRWERRQ